jgi:hypothetical protein
MERVNKIEQEISGSSFVQQGFSESNVTLRDEVILVAERYASELISLKKKEAVIHIDEIASGVAKFYEKVRKIIDWKDDNALRRGAIERILKRILFPKMAGFSSKGHNTKELAQTITDELVRGGHLPNHEIPQSRVNIVSIALQKYLFFLEHVYSSSGVIDVKKKNDLSMFIIEIAACEMEEILTRPVKEYGVMNAMTKILEERIEITPEGKISESEKHDLIRISVERRLYHLDDNYVTYLYLKNKYPQWSDPNQEEMKWFAENLASIRESSHEYINKKINKEFEGIADQVSTVFMLFDDVLGGLKDNPEGIKESIENRGKFQSLLTDAYNKRHSTLKTRLKNSAIFSTLSVFVSNFATFYLIEVPVAHLFYEEFNLLATIVDFILPTLVMFLLVIFIKAPKEDNIEKVMEVTDNLLYKDQEYDRYEINVEEKKLTSGRIFINIIYAISTILTLFGIGYVFYIAKLPMTSVIYDTFTITLTIYAAVIVRKESRELYVGDDRNFQDFLFDIMTVPLAKVGQLLSRKWKEYNVVAIATNFLIEIPLVTMLDFVEDWSKFIRERKSELR